MIQRAFLLCYFYIWHNFSHVKTEPPFTMSMYFHEHCFIEQDYFVPFCTPSYRQFIMQVTTSMIGETNDASFFPTAWKR